MYLFNFLFPSTVSHKSTAIFLAAQIKQMVGCSLIFFTFFAQEKIFKMKNNLMCFNKTNLAWCNNTLKLEMLGMILFGL